MGQPEDSGNTDEAVGSETAAPDTDSPLPSPPPSVTPTSSTSEELAEEAAAQYNDQRLMAMNPPAVPDCLPIDHNLPHLLVCSFAGRRVYIFKLV
jgi:hypothetical protein